jgi:hypothetical protein
MSSINDVNMTLLRALGVRLNDTTGDVAEVVIRLTTTSYPTVEITRHVLRGTELARVLSAYELKERS